MFLIVATGMIAGCSCIHRKDPGVSGKGIDTYNDPKTESTTIKNNEPHIDTILISEMRFQPSQLDVHKGDTIIWINHDLVSHCVTEKNKAWTSSTITSGGSWKLPVTQNADYFCAIHPVMTGKIVVK